MRLSPLPAVLLVAAALALGGCGSDSEPGPTAADPAATTGTTADAPAGTPPTVAPETSPTTSDPTPSAGPSARSSAGKPERTQGGNGDAAPADTRYRKGGGVCRELELADVADVVDGRVTGQPIESGGCTFAQADRRRPSVTFTERAWTGRAMDQTKTDATSAVEGRPRDIAGIGDRAFVVSGTIFGGDDIQSFGAVRVRDRLVSVAVVQHDGMKQEQTESILAAALRLVVDELR